MIFGQDRHELRKMYAEAWKKQLAGQPMSPLELQIAAVVAFSRRLRIQLAQAAVNGCALLLVHVSRAASRLPSR